MLNGKYFSVSFPFPSETNPAFLQRDETSPKNNSPFAAHGLSLPLSLLGKRMPSTPASFFHIRAAFPEGVTVFQGPVSSAVHTNGLCWLLAALCSFWVRSYPGQTQALFLPPFRLKGSGMGSIRVPRPKDSTLCTVSSSPGLPPAQPHSPGVL